MYITTNDVHFNPILALTLITNKLNERGEERERVELGGGFRSEFLPNFHIMYGQCIHVEIRATHNSILGRLQRLLSPEGHKLFEIRYLSLLRDI